MNRENEPKSRKPYMKPCVAVENFALDQFIAACDVDIREENWKDLLMSKDIFTYVALERTNQFVARMDCLVDADVKTSDMDTLCYHTATSPLFAS